MKKLILFLIVFSLLLNSSCEEEEMISVPPTANFTKRTNVIIADNTNARFESTSSGDIDSYSWEFEGGLGFSSSKDPSYVFEYEGAREVNLRVSGPGGSDDKSLFIAVHAFDPNCNNLNNSSTHSIAKINSLRDNNLVRNGLIKIKNNYSVTVDLLLYSPIDWINGKYTSRYRYTLNSGAEGILNVGGSAFQYSNEWGVRVQATNGVISCIRTVGAVGNFNGSQYDVLASNILDGI